jgi:hypothetical protein
MVRVREPGADCVQSLPGVAPMAMQQGRYAGRLIRRRLAGEPQPVFRYRNKGILATIGPYQGGCRPPAAERISGFPASALWLGVHLFYLIRFENRIVVMVRWSYNFFTHGRARLITGAPEPRTITPPPAGGMRAGPVPRPHPRATELDAAPNGPTSASSHEHLRTGWNPAPNRR